MENKAAINSMNLYAGMDFPYLVLDVFNERSYPVNPGFQVMHWHEDLQFLYLMEGNIKVQTLEGTVQLGEGEGVFINKNIVHRVTQLSPCHYCSFVFPDYFLSFYTGSPAQSLVSRLVGNNRLLLYRFTQKEAWQKRVLAMLRQLYQLEQEKSEFYVYEVLLLLASLWLELQKNIILPVKERASETQKRMQIFLRYIQEHYMDPVTLEEMAASANVSKSECLRCFRQSMRTTPYKYLSEFRLSKAAQLLLETDKPINEIAVSVGFQQLSHFGKCFREKTGYSPEKYRRMEH